MKGPRFLVWGGLKVGDPVLVYYEANSGQLSRPAKSIVRSIGPKWIIVNGGQKFSRENGRGEYAYQIHTEATLDEYHRRHTALRVIRDDRYLHRASVEQLEKLAAIYAEIRIDAEIREQK